MSDDIPLQPIPHHGKTMGSPKYKKAPDAPKRFKSAFIIFSAEKHKEIKAKLATEGRVEKTTDIAKMVSEAWRELNPEDKEVWEKRARKDKARYEVEKAMYKGPWKVPANKRTPKDPSAPKRPMSAFLAFSNKRRAALKRQHPDATNADLSKMLSKTWKEAEPSLRQKYMDEEAELRQHYKVEMAKWRKRVAEEKRVERKEREAFAMQAAENRDANGGSLKPPNQEVDPNNGGGMPQGFPGAAGMYGMPYSMPGQPGMGDMGGFGGAGAAMQHHPQAAYLNSLGANGFPGAMNASQMGAQQQLLSQLLAGQQMNHAQFGMPGRGPPMMGGYGGQPQQQQGGGQQQQQGGGQQPGAPGSMQGGQGQQGYGGMGGMPGMGGYGAMDGQQQDQGGYGGMGGDQGGYGGYGGLGGYGGPPPNIGGQGGGGEQGGQGGGGDDNFQRANL